MVSTPIFNFNKSYVEPPFPVSEHATGEIPPKKYPLLEYVEAMQRAVYLIEISLPEEYAYKGEQQEALRLIQQNPKPKFFKCHFLTSD